MDSSMPDTLQGTVNLLQSHAFKIRELVCRNLTDDDQVDGATLNDLLLYLDQLAEEMDQLSIRGSEVLEKHRANSPPAKEITPEDEAVAAELEECSTPDGMPCTMWQLCEMHPGMDYDSDHLPMTPVKQMKDQRETMPSGDATAHLQHTAQLTALLQHTSQTAMHALSIPGHSIYTTPYSHLRHLEQHRLSMPSLHYATTPFHFMMQPTMDQLNNMHTSFIGTTLPAATPDPRVPSIYTTPPPRPQDLPRGQGANFNEAEDIALCASFLYVSKDPIVGANQTSEAYWERIREHFHLSPDAIHWRPKMSLQKHWGEIAQQTNKFCGHWQTVQRLNPSGKNEDDKISQAKELYYEDGNKHYKFLH
ncbi:hypothetical protein U9M48_024216 [Paspalum notatum var. saurae]|uniref:Uncharacterized protein n=1 Tax=Paspalum notatum var. saurae TaxID=547442 RepID=A0AAQ3WVS4_PASNO